MNLRSLHFRLIAWYSALVIVVVLSFGAFTYRSLQHRLTEEMVETLTRRAEAIRDNILHSTPLPSAHTIARQIQSVYSPEASSRFIRIINHKGEVVYVSGTPKDQLFNPGDIPLLQQPPSEITQHYEPLASEFTLLIVTVPEQVNGDTWFVEMGVPTDQIDTALHELLVTLLISLPLLVLIAAAGGYALVRRSLKPVEDIRATAEKITFGNLSNRLPISRTGDAMEHLSITLNQMLERLESAFQQASRFSADASHELRTPLTIMRTELESIMQEPVFSEALRERVGSVLEETEHLSHIAESLFAISRLDAGEAKMESAALDMADLVSSTAEQMQLLAEEKHIAMEIEAIRPVPVSGDRTRLKQAVVNLLDNAVKYTLPGGKIHVRVLAVGATAIFEIRDNGMGISKTALPHVFERFYRDEEARQQDIGGAGLGLSIVRSVVQAHGGHVDIQSAIGTGTKVTVELPLAEQGKRE